MRQVKRIISIKLRKGILSEISYILLACWLWFASLGNFVMVACDKIFHTDMFFRTDGRVVIGILFLLFSLPFMGKKLRPFDYILFVFLVGLYLLTYFFTSEENKLIVECLNGFLLAVPMYLVGRTFDFSAVKSLFYILSIISIISAVYYNLVFILSDSYAGDNKFLNENMSQAYLLLPHIIFMIWYTFDTFSFKKIVSIFNLLVVIIGVFALLMLGTRGPVVCVGLFLVYYFFFYKTPRNKFLYRTSLVVLALLLLAFLEPILVFLSNIAYRLGFSERVFEFFIYGQVLASSDMSSGRFDYFDILFSALNESPIWGYGFLGSYYFIRSYPHNVFIDLLFSFGYFLGGISILCILKSIYSAITKASNYDEKGFLCVLIGTGIIGLLFSDTFVVSPYFFMCVGYSFQISTRKKQYRRMTKKEQLCLNS